jgi:hypothetical protein
MTKNAITSCAVILSVSALLNGCSKACNDMYAPDFVRVRLQLEGSEPGTDCYVIDVVADDVHQQLAWRMDGDDAGANCGTGSNSEADWLLPEIERHTDDEVAVTFFFKGAPKQMTLELAHEGEPVLSRMIQPKYKESEPNGDGCGTRRSADVEIIAE